MAPRSTYPEDQRKGPRQDRRAETHLPPLGTYLCNINLYGRRGLLQKFATVRDMRNKWAMTMTYFGGEKISCGEQSQ